MGATDFSWLSADTESPTRWASLQKRLRTRFSLHCAFPDCPKAGRLWPAWLQTSEGIEFDGRWYCGRSCLEAILAGRVYALLSGVHSERPRAHRFPLGLLLVGRRVISTAQLREALHLQREAGHGKLGDWLRQSAGLSAHQLTAALAQQWGCPYFPLENHAVPVAWSHLIPVEILESACTVPAHASPDGRALHLAFSERVDHTLLYAVDQMLRCRTFPCVAPAAAIHAQIEQFRRLTSGNSTCFDTVRESPEMTRTICNYAAELRARRLVLARAGAFVWVRFFCALTARDLLFRILPDISEHSHERPPGRLKVSRTLADGRKGGVSDASAPL